MVMEKRLNIHIHCDDELSDNTATTKTMTNKKNIYLKKQWKNLFLYWIGIHAHVYTTYVWTVLQTYSHQIYPMMLYVDGHRIA